MKLLLALLFSLSCFQICFAQLTLSGKLVSEGGDPVRYANVVLCKSDSTILQGTTSDSTGQFQINKVNAGRYLLKVFGLGYATTTKAVDISQTLHVGEIQLTAAASELEEIVISDQRASVNHQFDKVVLSSSKSITSSAGNVLDLVEKLPGVIVNHQNKSILIRGRDDIQVLINNKPTNVPISVVLQMLSGVNAAAVERIELLTAPSSRYDANGTAGILSIILKDIEDVGTKLIYNINTGWGRGMKGSADINFLKKTNKLTTSLLASQSYDDTKENWESYQYSGANSINTLVNRDPEIWNSLIKGELTYQAGSKLTIDAGASFGARKWLMNSSSTTLKIEDGNSRFIVLSDEEEDSWNNFTAGLGLKYKISEHGAIALNYDHLYYKNTDFHDYNQKENDSDGGEISNSLFSISKRTPIDIDVVNADFEGKAGNSVTYNVGAKQTFAKFRNHLDFNPSGTFYDFLEGNYHLTEKTIAAYGNLVVTRQKLKVETGVRYEHTSYELLKDAIVTLNSRRYAAFFPSFNAFYSLSEKSNLQLIYNYRINRPAYSSLAPFVVFLDPFTFFTGNENLQPSFVHTIELKHGFNQFILSAGYSAEDSPMIGFQPEVNQAEGYQIIAPRNLSNRRAFTVSVYAPIRISDAWQVTSDVSYSYTTIENTPTNFSTALGSYRASVSSVVNITTSLTAEISGFYQSTSLFGLTRQRSFGAVNAGIRKKIKNLDISASVSDILKTNNWTITGEDAAGNQTIKRYYDFETRIFRIGISHTIGNQKLSKKKQAPVSSDERNRI